MDRGMGVPVDAAQDAWDWEVLQPDFMSSRMSHGDGTNLADDQETGELVTTPQSSDDGDGDAHDETPPDECKDIGVVQDESTKPSKEEEEEEEEEEAALREVTGDMPASDGEADEEEKRTLQSLHDDSDTKKPEDGQADDDEDEEKEEKEEEEDELDDIKKDNGGEERPAPAECVVFSVAKLIKVHGIGALCSFGVAAATVCIFLIGGRMQQQHHHHRQQQEQQFYGDDKRIQQVVQQTSRLNHTMSSVMGGSGGSTRANISFGGFYDGL